MNADKYNSIILRVLFEINLSTSASAVLKVCLASIIDYSSVKGEK